MPSIPKLVLAYYCLILILPLGLFIMESQSSILQAVFKLSYGGSTRLIGDINVLNMQLFLATGAGFLGLITALVIPQKSFKRSSWFPPAASHYNKNIGIIVQLLTLIILANKFRNAAGAGFNIDHIVSTYMKHHFYPNSLSAFLLGSNFLHRFIFSFVNIKLLRDLKVDDLTGKLRWSKSIIIFNLLFFGNDFAQGSLSRLLFNAFTLYFLYTVILSTKQSVSFFRFLTVAGLISLSAIVLRTMANLLIHGTGSATLAFDLIYFYMNRLNFVVILDRVIKYGQELYPRGTLADLWTNLFPFSNSELIFDGNQFGRLIGINHKWDFTTGIASTVFAEFYLNMGLLGIFFGSLLIGLYASTFNTKKVTEYYIFRVALLLPILLHGLESPFTVLIPSLITYELLIFVVFRLRHSSIWRRG